MRFPLAEWQYDAYPIPESALLLTPLYLLRQKLKQNLLYLPEQKPIAQFKQGCNR